MPSKCWGGGGGGRGGVGASVAKSVPSMSLSWGGDKQQ